jgi:hypothetical protein
MTGAVFGLLHGLNEITPSATNGIGDGGISTPSPLQGASIAVAAWGRCDGDVVRLIVVGAIETCPSPPQSKICIHPSPDGRSRSRAAGYSSHFLSLKGFQPVARGRAFRVRGWQQTVSFEGTPVQISRRILAVFGRLFGSAFSPARA